MNGKRIGGFSIVEALVALVVLAVGMLGIAALYVESLRAGRSAVYRTQAVNLASDMADRIRANRNAGEAYELAGGDNPAVQGCADTGGGSATCAPEALAQDDLARWLAAIREALPGNGNDTPSGTIDVEPAVVPTQYTITVTWSEPGEAQNLTYVLPMQI